MRRNEQRESGFWSTSAFAALSPAVLPSEALSDMVYSEGFKPGACGVRALCGFGSFPESREIPVVWECIDGKALEGTGD